MDPMQMKIAEKIIILNDRAVGMITRLYNVKKDCCDPKSKPYLLMEKSLEGCIKHITRKFPVVDTRSNNNTFSQASVRKQDIINCLSFYYYTFADILDLKDHIMQLLTNMDACQFNLDITINYELTSGYLNLVVNLICMMILMSRVEDRKALVGLFNAAFELCNGQSESSFPRLGQMILDYESPLKKLSEDLGPLNRLIHSAISSLASVYIRRNTTAEAWSNAQMLSLVASPQQILYAAQTDTIACEYLSLDVMDRWIIFGVTVCHNKLLQDPGVAKLWQLALQTGLAVRLFRDEVLLVHHTIQSFFDSIKGYGRKIQEVKDNYSLALQTSLAVHHDRRVFLRNALRELCLLIKDQPGLLGPKILFVWMALSFSRDEVVWLLRHADIWPSGGGKKSKHAGEVTDKRLPELLASMHELRFLVQRHSNVIQRYYTQYVHGYDALALTEIVQKLEGLTDEQSALLSDFCADVTRIDDKDVDLRGLRLDWFRFQAYVSRNRSSFSLTDEHNRKFAETMNTTVFHLKMVDLLEEMLRETSDLSLYCFYSRHLEAQLFSCLKLPSQARYSIAFGHICSHFNSAVHEMCPEEKIHIREKSLSLCNMVLEKLANEASNVVSRICTQEMRLDECSSAAYCAKVLEENFKAQNSKVQRARMPLAGEESVRICRDTLTQADMLQTSLFELCSAIAASREIDVSGHSFVPREYFSRQLEQQMTKSIQELIKIENVPKRPSELLAQIHAHMTVLQNVDTAVTIDITRLFNNVLLQQTQPMDCNSMETITSTYTKWYLELLRRMSNNQVLFSSYLACLLPSSEFQQPFSADEYTDTRELRALAQLLGPYGIKFMSERLVWHVACQVSELNKIVIEHRETLRKARSNFDKPEKMRELLTYLSGESLDKKNQGNTVGPMDSILQRIIIVGEILAFRELLHKAIHDVLETRLPFLLPVVHNLHETSSDHNKLVISEMCAAVGVDTEVDVALLNAVRAQNQPAQSAEEQYLVSCLLFVFIALSLPRLALSSSNLLQASICASQNNSQCIAIAVSSLANALFCLHGKGDVVERLKEFLALASSGLLRLSNEESSDLELLKSRHSIYIILDQLVNRCPYLTFDLLESCLPYDLIRSSYQYCHRKEIAK